MGCAPSQQDDGKSNKSGESASTTERTRSSAAPDESEKKQQPESSSGGPPPHTHHDSDEDETSPARRNPARSPSPPVDEERGEMMLSDSADGGHPPAPDRNDTVAYMSTSGSNPDLRTVVKASNDSSPGRSNPLNDSGVGGNNNNSGDDHVPRDETDSPPPPDDPLLDHKSGVIMSDESAGVLTEPSGAHSSGVQQQGEEEDPKLLSKSSSTPGAASMERTKRDIWNELQGRLPVEKDSTEEREKRFSLFKDFDPNGNGYLSLAEVDHGCRTILRLHELQDPLQPILIRAFNAAKDARQKRGKGKTVGEDYVEKSEFRLLLVYIKSYFELYIMFDEVDSSEDRRVDEDEFTRSLGKLEQWGVPKIEDPAAAFSAIDTNGGGLILFEEFADWASSQHLTIQSEFEDDE